MLRPRLRIPRAGALLRRATLFARSEHTVPTIEHFKPQDGVPGLLSPAGYATAWTDYMQHITEKLNHMTVAILKSAARNPEEAAIFNYASMAHNNHFFFSQLVNLQSLYEQRSLAHAEAGGDVAEVELEESEKRIPPRLMHDLETHFSSIETLRREFLNTALGMFGPGFVWLVKNATTPDLRILATYLAGSPYTAAHWRRQGIDWNTAVGDRSTVSDLMDRTRTAAGNLAAQYRPQAPGGTDVIPLLCLNTWEHVWLTDYGISGKGQYIQQWWETIDWDKVAARAYPPQQNKLL